MNLSKLSLHRVHPSMAWCCVFSRCNFGTTMDSLTLPSRRRKANSFVGSESSQPGPSEFHCGIAAVTFVRTTEPAICDTPPVAVRLSPPEFPCPLSRYLVRSRHGDRIVRWFARPYWSSLSRRPMPKGCRSWSLVRPASLLAVGHNTIETAVGCSLRKLPTLPT